MTRAALMVALLVSQLSAACDNFGPPTPAEEACTAPAHDYNGSVVGAFQTTVGAMRNLERGMDPPRWPELTPDYPAVLCFIDADIAKGPPPGPGGSIAPSFDRLLVGVVDGAAEVLIAGYRDQLPVRAP